MRTNDMVMKAGLLPLLAGLYDEQNPAMKDTYRPFIDEIIDGFSAVDIQMVKSPVCIREDDIQKAMDGFAQDQVCAVVVLFLAYHPSMVSAQVLARSDLPLIMLDTTLCYRFDEQTDPANISLCHGIHGVQDLCCVLRRMGKGYMIEAGHYTQSDVIARTAARIRACLLARAFKTGRVGLIGRPFENMGDFAIPFDRIEALTGVKTLPLAADRARALCGAVGDAEAESQAGELKNAFEPGENVDESLLNLAAVTTSAIGKWISEERLTAFSFNFLDFTADLGLPSIPFVAACRMMDRGIGYAGEGDILTAALASALMGVYPDTTFTEMFCPDWEGETVFLSHMGEAHGGLLRHARLIPKTVPYVPGLNGGVMPCVAGALRGGSAVLVNLAPGPGDGFRLILSPCTLKEPVGDEGFVNHIRGWMKPRLPLADFLRQYSLLGGTHHCCLSYGADIGVLESFGALMGWEVQLL